MADAITVALVTSDALLHRSVAQVHSSVSTPETLVFEQPRLASNFSHALAATTNVKEVLPVLISPLWATKLQVCGVFFR